MLETLVAGFLFLTALVGSLQLWTSAAAGSQSQQERQLQRDAIERDRLLLEQHWRQVLASESHCPTADQLLAQAQTQAAAPELQRRLDRSADGQAVRVQWGGGTSERQLWRTAAGLGLCRPQPAPMTSPQQAPL